MVELVQLRRGVAGGGDIGIIANQQGGGGDKYTDACGDHHIKDGLAQGLFLPPVRGTRIEPVGIVAGAAGWLLVLQGASLLW